MTDRRSSDVFPPQPGSDWKLRALRVLVILLTAIIGGGVAGLLTWADGASVPRAILTAGGAFAGTTALLLGIAHYARVP